MANKAGVLREYAVFQRNAALPPALLLYAEFEERPKEATLIGSVVAMKKWDRGGAVELACELTGKTLEEIFVQPLSNLTAEEQKEARIHFLMSKETQRLLFLEQSLQQAAD